MTELSPQAQAVLDAFNREARPEPHHQQEAIAAALRAAVAQTQQRQYGDCWICAANELLTIAAELKAAND
jgi:hypothetical protein